MLLTRFEIYPNAYYNYLKNRKSAFNKNKKLIQNQIEKTFNSENGKM